MAESKPRVAYFCMEFGLHESFRIYSGGLGILAGDILKAAYDAGDPLVGVGILWRQGYVEQRIDGNGLPYDSFHEYRYDFLEDTGVTVKVLIRGRQVKAKVWKCTAFENVPLYLLDTNLPDNADWAITGQLYGWFEEERIAQEMILSIGGLRALKALGIDVDICHFNDSHPVFAGVELIHEEMEQGLDFDEALRAVKQKIVFTTHTPVVAGNEVHGHELLRYMGAECGLSYGQMLKLGGDPFSMTAAGLRLSRRANAVAQLHGETARRMWHDVPGGDDIIAITNGVHNKTWQDAGVLGAAKNGGDLWAEHMRLKRAMLAGVERRAGVKLEENVLTIGFARRAAPYKRSDLIFRDKELISALLRGGKLQILFSGKAHPNDLTGKRILSNLVRISKEFPGRVVFLEDYDMAVGKMLTRGCDVWLNNPARPMEASGTSGMKAAMNGVLNFSVLDGWWPEGCRHGETGWQMGGGYEGPDADAVDAASLYKVLTEEILPAYYGPKEHWAQMMKNSIEMSTWQFSAARMLEEYYGRLYAPAE